MIIAQSVSRLPLNPLDDDHVEEPDGNDGYQKDIKINPDEAEMVRLMYSFGSRAGARRRLRRR